MWKPLEQLKSILPSLILHKQFTSTIILHTILNRVCNCQQEQKNKEIVILTHVTEIDLKSVFIFLFSSFNHIDTLFAVKYTFTIIEKHGRQYIFTFFLSNFIQSLASLYLYGCR